MADSVPILTWSDSESHETSNSEKLLPSLDEMIEQRLENFGWKMFLQSFVAALVLFFDSQQSFIGIYTDANPTWHCVNHTICSSDSDICKLPKSAWAWDSPSSNTIISYWGLECANSFTAGLPQSSFFMGSFIGGYILATLADSSLGRKNLIFLSSLTMSLASTAIVFSYSFWIYSALKFFSGFCRSSIAASIMVLLTEKVGTKWRFRVGIFAFSSFTLGFLSLPAIAYLNRDSSWKFLYLWTSVPAMFYSVFAYFFVTESPRWLLMQGREEEAMAILKGTAAEEGGEDLILSLLKVNHAKPESSILNLYSSITQLCAKTWAIKRMLVLMVLAFGIGMVYYGMPLGVGTLGFNIYLASTFNALLEVPSFIAIYFLENCRRRTSIFVFTAVSGICSILCVVAGNGLKGAKISLELASFFSGCTACNVLNIYILELFPTCVRSTTMSLVRQAIICGAIFGPFLASAGRKVDIFFYGVLGVIVMCCGLSVVCLPETKGSTLCDTMDQQENKESFDV
ncbi:hypothetical protein L6164_018093 [Bauhinia variegata]|uniref:Uncharacterized protein n=1 Tax=Bauhinia variegata TaxID=167791 RepID=A0ACB9NEX2_BAUVA|nr:hypothetical protein L6164_018093 [Bauhinia variegata]